MTTLKIGDRVRTERFKNGKTIDFDPKMKEFIGKNGYIESISYGGNYEVHGWYWPLSALTLIKEGEV